MSEKKSLKVNFIMNAILTMSAFLFPLISFPYVSRILLPEGTGKVSFATSLISYFVMFAQLGIPTYGVRACARVRDDKHLLSKTAHELLIINLVMTVVSYAVLALALIFVPRLQEDRLLYIVVSMNIFFTTIGMEWLYKALEQYTYITLRSIIFKAISLVAMFLLVHEKEDYVMYGGITIVASSASFLLNFVHARKYILMRPMGGYDFKPHLKAVMVFFAMSCASTIYTHLDTVMLGFIDGDVAVGYYNAAVRIKNILVSIVTSLGTVLLPRASYYVEHKLWGQFRDISRKALNFVFVAASSMMVYFIMFAQDGIFLLSGEEYAGSILPMRLAMPTLLFIGVSNILGIQILVPMGKETYVLWSIIAGAAVDLVLNIVLIPLFGASGAAAANMIAEATVMAVQIVMLRKEIMPSLKKIQYWKMLLALAAGVAASFWVDGLGLGSFLSLLLSAVLFFAAYGVTLLITREQLVREVLGQILGKLKRKK
ncbi:MAG: oligosaccharide flippase family protein [Oscillospiraceae bacterium]|nr:oligosaccharide flippase family protein [Oscillospiraceae bacterium]